MKLVVLGREKLDELESWVTELFAGVENKDLSQNRWDEVQPYSDKEFLTQVFAKPVMDTRLLDLYFPFQDEEYMYETHPSRYMSHLIGHEGPGSILAYIKAKGWANGLSAGAKPVCPGSAFFTVSVKLTEDGLKEYREVVKVIFQYISLIKESPPQEWIFDETKGMAEVDFKFQQKSRASSFTSRLSSVMQHPLPRQWLLSGTQLLRRFDSTAITQALSYLRADNYRLTLVSQNFPGDWDKKERWYGTEYKAQPIEPEFQSAIRQALETTTENRIPDLHLPHRNEFIPTKLTVDKREVAESMKAPKLIRNDEMVRTWWKKDDRFWVPKGNVYISLRNPLTKATPANAVRSSLYCELVRDALVEYSYDAEIAGLYYNLGSCTMGIDIEVSGYSDKMSVLLEKVLVSMRDLEVKPDRFNIVKERQLRGMRNWRFQQPYRQVGDFTTWLNSERAMINEQYLAELTPLTPADVATFYPQLLRQVHIEFLAHGNIYKEDALRMSNLVESTLKPRKLPKSQWQIRRSLIVPSGGDFTYQHTLGDPANVNHCIEYYLFVGDLADRTLRAQLLLFAQMTDEIGFDQLRTKEQLGYIVFTGPKLFATTMGYRVIIQSERSPDYLEERINAFLAMFASKLQDMTTEEFESHKKSLINKRLEKIKNLDQESERFWNHISSEYFDFWQNDLDAVHLRPLTKQDLIDFFERHIHPTSSTRAKLAVHMIAQSSPKAAAGNMSPAEQKEKLITLLGKYLTSTGADVDAEALNKRFESVDVAGGDQTNILRAVSRYLTEDAQVEAERASQIVEQGQQLLGTVMPSLGIEVQRGADADEPEKNNDASAVADGEADESAREGDEGKAAAGGEKLPEAPKGMKATVFIEDVREYKSRLALTPGPSAVTELSEFEELEPKL